VINEAIIDSQSAAVPVMVCTHQGGNIVVATYIQPTSEEVLVKKNDFIPHPAKLSAYSLSII